MSTKLLHRLAADMRRQAKAEGANQLAVGTYRMWAWLVLRSIDACGYKIVKKES